MVPLRAMPHNPRSHAKFNQLWLPCNAWKWELEYYVHWHSILVPTFTSFVAAPALCPVQRIDGNPNLKFFLLYLLVKNLNLENTRYKDMMFDASIWTTSQCSWWWLFLWNINSDTLVVLINFAECFLYLYPITGECLVNCVLRTSSRTQAVMFYIVTGMWVQFANKFPIFSMYVAGVKAVIS